MGRSIIYNIRNIETDTNDELKSHLMIYITLRITIVLYLFIAIRSSQFYLYIIFLSR